MELYPARAFGRVVARKGTGEHMGCAVSYAFHA